MAERRQAQLCPSMTKPGENESCLVAPPHSRDAGPDHSEKHGFCQRLLTRSEAASRQQPSRSGSGDRSRSDGVPPQYPMAFSNFCCSRRSSCFDNGSPLTLISLRPICGFCRLCVRIRGFAAQSHPLAATDFGGDLFRCFPARIYLGCEAAYREDQGDAGVESPWHRRV
jgi:hypothetical protein